ncbi:RiPP maturation radical SAM C-methyltransferase [Streptomyces sp. NPDC053474]|uniref:RiPP maturation radical SAM C-methyltransferase n=1 Tax=Streptomyces sp. NPDC053474 TaxID=3365704 RepID=UPI0037CF3336
MRVVLVNMPWASAEVPSLALGILKRAVTSALPQASVEVLYANLDFVDWICDRRSFTADDYQFFSHGSYFEGAGDWVFSSALYDDRHWRTEEFTAAKKDRLPDDRLDLCRDLHHVVPDFIDDLAARICTGPTPDVVGFTTTFQQNTAALAAARRVKQLSPRTLVVFGGANCDGAQGEALHRNFPFIDYVLRGESEVSFPRLLDAVQHNRATDDIPGLCHRLADGSSKSAPMAAEPLPPAAVPGPDYDGYYERVTTSQARRWSDPQLVLEASRGCWWGEKHHCTFCGLNGSFMQFRSKRPEVFFDEITDLVARHRVLDVVVVDNILDMGYLTSLLPRISASGYDLRLHYEIKSNLRREQLRVLADAGLLRVQPGIESLSSHVLKLMDKGVTACQNVRMLRDAATVGLVPEWNYLYGFPGETDAHYTPVITQLPALHHLTPAESVGRIAIERFSPYFDRPDLGFDDLRPDSQYELIYDLPPTQLMDFAYLFEATPQGISEHTADALRASMQAWEDAWASSHLDHVDLGDRVVLTNRRSQFDWSLHQLTTPLEIKVFHLLDQPRTVASLERRTGADSQEISALLDRWRELGLLFTEGEHVVHVVPAAANQELLRLRPERLQSGGSWPAPAINGRNG